MTLLIKREAKRPVLLALLLLVGCSNTPTAVPITPTPTLIPTPTPIPPPPSPDTTASAFLNAWETGDYGAMYARLSPASQAAINAESFVQRYQNALATATVLTVSHRLQSALQEDDQAHVSFEMRLDTALVGTLITETVMSLSMDGGQWWVDWDEGLIWPQLQGGHYFRMEYIVPARANIYDRAGLGLATEGTIVTIGVIPNQITDENVLLEAVASVTDLSPEEIRGRYVAAPADWKVPIADISAEASVEHNELLSSIPGIYREEKEGRTYPRGNVAPHVVGWVAPVPAEQLDDYRARGYRGDEWVGVSGLEAWGEDILAGVHGGALTIVTSTGEEIVTVAVRPAVPSRTIYTTFDRDFQEQVQQILGGRKGAIVVLDVRTGAVRALASGPGFDPNVFVGPAGAVGRAQILADPRRPLFNRATQGTYPSASVFKIISMSAAMEEGGMTPEQTFFYCPGYWEGLGPGSRKTCWKTEGHGDINLKDGLTASCDVVFYAVGQRLDGVSPDILPRFGRGFGFGEPTGLEGVLEDSGLVPDPVWKAEVIGENWWVGDTVNLVIGQGYLLVTPLQVARMIAAVANGGTVQPEGKRSGTLYRPYIIERIGPVGDQIPEQVTQPQAIGTLPISPEHLAVIQEAMLGVTTKSIGTAPHRFVGLNIPVAGKTGTAEVGGPDTVPHSWFAAYAPAGSPEIAIAALVENAGEGSTVAAPLVRQVIEAYYGLPLSPLPPQAEEGYVPPPDENGSEGASASPEATPTPEP